MRPQREKIRQIPLSETDALVARVETVTERLKEYRTSQIFSAVTGKIDVREAV